MRRALVALGLGAAVLVSACGAPPSKEMGEAQGALDAARAAGAERFAPESFQSAADALARAQQAVAERDYRHALSDALDSRERAQNAAREAADTKAARRGDAERALSEMATRVAALRERVSAPTPRTPARLLAARHAALATLDQLMQDAGTAIRSDDYARADSLLASTREQAEGMDKELQGTAKAQPAPRPRSR